MKVKVKVVCKPNNTRCCPTCGRRIPNKLRAAILIQREIIMISAEHIAA